MNQSGFVGVRSADCGIGSFTWLTTCIPNMRYRYAVSPGLLPLAGRSANVPSDDSGSSSVIIRWTSTFLDEDESVLQKLVQEFAQIYL